TFGQHRVVERGEKHQQRTPAQSRSDEGADFVEVRRGVARFQRIERVAACGVVLFAILRAQENVGLVGKREQPEQVALLLGGLGEDQGGSDETLQRGRESKVEGRGRRKAC